MFLQAVLKVTRSYPIGSIYVLSSLILYHLKSSKEQCEDNLYMKWTPSNNLCKVLYD